MGSYNILHATTTCPRNGETGPVEIEFTFGRLDFRDYRVGDTLDWGTKGLREPKQRPVGGDYDNEGYVECPVCHKDYWVWITVRADVITDVRVDPTRPGHIP
ncbi:hypothetical protein [Actinacidiphila alni]|uniref:hypothetical protein n=1 Tax=Actinacidiphila alni TaxID=380248 RepID=UPI0034568B1E